MPERIDAKTYRKGAEAARAIDKLFGALALSWLFVWFLICSQSALAGAPRRKAQAKRPQPRQGEKMKVANRSASDVPLACNLAGLNGEQMQRRQALNKQLREAVEEIRELPDGYGFRFPAKTVLAVAEFIMLERMCCPFFTFEIEIKSGQSEPLWLRITGPEGVKQILQSGFTVK